jgi:hypothetical protein
VAGRDWAFLYSYAISTAVLWAVSLSDKGKALPEKGVAS